MSEAEELSGIRVKIGLPVEDLVSAIKEMSQEDREFLIENLLAATSPEYSESIEEARKDYREGRVTPHSELFKG